MDPVLLIAEWWWVAPTAGAGVAAGAFGMRYRGRANGRRLAYDAARHDLRAARQKVAEQRMALKVARADVARVMAERSAQRAGTERVASAKRMLREKERELKAAYADVRATQARLNAARAAIPASSGPGPLERLQAEHEAITARWMQYETDPALQIAYPAMTDVKHPATAAYLRAAGHAAEMRRAASGKLVTPAEFAAYRDAVADLVRAFDVAEHAAKGQAGQTAAPVWQETAQDMIARSAEAIDKAAAVAASAFAAWKDRNRTDKSRD